jgi:glycosyltransferase involved in cell wall biosynthesis
MEETKTHRVLMIAYFLPPKASVGNLRTLKFIKYLPTYGWTPKVLSIKPSKNETLDSSLEEDIPKDTEVYRTNSHELFLNKLFSKIHHDYHWFILPDPHIGWLPSAVKFSLSICKKDNVDIIYTTSPPNSTNLIGLIVKKLTNIPLVIDFRDPWTQNPGYKNYPTDVHRRVDEFLEHLVSKNANRIVFNTPPNLIDFIKKYPDIPLEKCKVITNGYDSDDFRNLKLQQNEKFTITYTGSLYGERPFFMGLSQVLKEKPNIRSDIKIVFAGRHPWIKYQIDEFGLQDVVEIKGYIPYKKNLQIMMDSDVLLLTQLPPSPGVERWCPNKLFEYLATGKPILGIIPKGFARDLLESSSSSIIVDYNDLDGIKKAICLLYDRYKEKELIPTSLDELDRYDRKKLTHELASLFNEIIQSKQGKRRAKV